MNGKLEESFFFTDSSIMLMLWFACDSQGMDIFGVLSGYDLRSDSEDANKILANMSDRSLMSKFDILYDDQAVANAYNYFLTMDMEDPVGAMMNVCDEFIDYIAQKYDLENVNIVCNLDDKEIYND